MHIINQVQIRYCDRPKVPVQSNYKWYGVISLVINSENKTNRSAIIVSPTIPILTPSPRYLVFDVLE